jgi:hypothetical protein
VSNHANERDCQLEKHTTFKFPWDIGWVAVDLDVGAQVAFKYVTTQRYKRQSSQFGTYLTGQTVSIGASVAKRSHLFLFSFGTKNPRGIG